MAAVKFCGLTRPQDVELVRQLGAAYAGVIFAGGPRLVSGRQAAALLATLPSEVRRVGVFGEQGPLEVAALAAEARLDVVQLHATPDVDGLQRVRAALPAGVEVWSVVRVTGGDLPAHFAALVAASDAVVVDSLVPGQLGGTGFAADWVALAQALDVVGRPSRLVLAGGLRPDNVARAVARLSPDVVDVSSGVELAPGVKDPDLMLAFSRAARAPQPVA